MIQGISAYNTFLRGFLIARSFNLIQFHAIQYNIIQHSTARVQCMTPSSGHCQCSQSFRLSLHESITSMHKTGIGVRAVRLHCMLQRLSRQGHNQSACWKSSDKDVFRNVLVRWYALSSGLKHVRPRPNMHGLRHSGGRCNLGLHIYKRLFPGVAGGPAGRLFSTLPSLHFVHYENSAPTDTDCDSE